MSYHLLLPLFIEGERGVVIGDIENIEVVVFEGDLLVLEETVVQFIVNLVLVRAAIRLPRPEEFDQSYRTCNAQCEVIENLSKVLHRFHIGRLIVFRTWLSHWEPSLTRRTLEKVPR